MSATDTALPATGVSVFVTLLILALLALLVLALLRDRRRRDAAGIADDLIAWHREHFGVLRMEDDDEPDDDDDPDDDKDKGDDDPDDDDPDDDRDKDKLGDAGKKALDRMKQQRNAARTAMREYKALGLSPAEIKKILDARKKGDDDQPDAEQIREQARTEARAEVLRDRVMDKIEAKAGARFNLDPEDVAALLMRRHEVDDFLDDGKVDAEAIQDALDELLEKKPNLAADAQGKDGKRFKGGGDGGARKGSRPEQLTRDDLKRMSPEQIEKARQDGKLDDLLAGTKK